MNDANYIMDAVGLILPIAAACIHLSVLIWAIVRNIKDGGLMKTNLSKILVLANYILAIAMILFGLFACLYKQLPAGATDTTAKMWEKEKIYVAGEIYMSLPLNTIRITAAPLYIMGTAAICIYMWIDSCYGKKYIPALITGATLIIYALSTLTASRWLIIWTGLTALLSTGLLWTDDRIAREREEKPFLQKDRILLSSEYANICGNIMPDKTIRDMPDGFQKTVLTIFEKRKRTYRTIQGDIEFCADSYYASIREIRELVIWASPILFAVGIAFFAIAHAPSITNMVTAEQIQASGLLAEYQASAVKMVNVDVFITVCALSMVVYANILSLLFCNAFTDPKYTPLIAPENEYASMRVFEARQKLLDNYKEEEALFKELAQANQFALLREIKQMFSVAYDSTYDADTETMTTTAYVSSAPNQIPFMTLSDDGRYLHYTPTKTVTDPDILSKEFPMHPKALKKKVLQLTAYPDYGFLKTECFLDYKEGAAEEYDTQLNEAYKELMIASLERATTTIPNSGYELETWALKKSSLKGYIHSGMDKEDSAVRETVLSILNAEEAEICLNTEEMETCLNAEEMET